MKYLIKLVIITFSITVFYTANAQTITDTTKLAFYNKDTLLYLNNVFLKDSNNYKNKNIAFLIDRIDLSQKIITVSNYIRHVSDSTNMIEVYFTTEKTRTSLAIGKTKGSYFILKIFTKDNFHYDETFKIIYNENYSWHRVKNIFMNMRIKKFHFYKVQF